MTEPDDHFDDQSTNSDTTTVVPSDTNTCSDNNSSDDASDKTSSNTSCSSDIEVLPEPTAELQKPLSLTFKIVGDNIDKTVVPRDMRSDYQTRSLHYFHSYAVRDRVNVDGLNETMSCPDIGAIDLNLLLPTPQDEREILKNMSILVARILKKHIPFFKKLGKGIEKHIPHQYSEEMSGKSNVVS